MKSVYIVMVLGYWGKGPDIKTAAQNCKKQGAMRRDPVLVKEFSGETLEPKEVNVDDWGCINYPASARDVTLITPRTGKTTLGSLLK